MRAPSDVRLWDAEPGSTSIVDRVSDHDPEGLRYLAEAGIRPGGRVEVVRRGPVGGPLFVLTAESASECALSKELAETVWVRKEAKKAGAKR